MELLKPCITGETRGYSALHQAIDFGHRDVTHGYDVYAANAGTLHWQTDAWYGNSVYIVHPDKTQTWYRHLSARHIKDGVQVEAHQLLGTMGDTGRFAKGHGAHLHFEYRVRGIKRNPTFVHTLTPAAETITPIKDDDMATLYSQAIKMSGNPPEYDIFTGFATITLEQDELKIHFADAGITPVIVKQKVGESSTKWGARKAAIQSVRNKVAAANIKALRG